MSNILDKMSCGDIVGVRNIGGGTYMFMFYDRRIDYVFYAIIALIFLVIIVKALKKAKRNPAKYDERQILLRGKAYKMGFITILGLAILYVSLIPVFDELITYGYLFNGIIMVVGVMVFVVYSIWNDAFFSLKDDIDSYILMNIVIIIANCVSMPPIAKDVNFIEDVLLSNRFFNILSILSFTIILIILLIKKYIDRKEEE